MNLLQPTTAANFNDPIGMLKACHEKIQAHCQLLVDLNQYIQIQGIDQDAINTAIKIHRYFSTAAKNHHQDEESDLFPLLKKTDSLNKIINKLEDDHQVLEEQWRSLETVLNKHHLKNLTDMKNEILIFQKHYEQHINIENNDLFPQAYQLISAKQFTLIGNSMRRRRLTDR